MSKIKCSLVTKFVGLVAVISIAPVAILTTSCGSTSNIAGFNKNTKVSDLPTLIANYLANAKNFDPLPKKLFTPAEFYAINGDYQRSVKNWFAINLTKTNYTNALLNSYHTSLDNWIHNDDDFGLIGDENYKVNYFKIGNGKIQTKISVKGKFIGTDISLTYKCNYKFFMEGPNIDLVCDFIKDGYVAGKRIKEYERISVYNDDYMVSFDADDNWSFTSENDDEKIGALGRIDFLYDDTIYLGLTEVQ